MNNDKIPSTEDLQAYYENTGEVKTPVDQFVSLTIGFEHLLAGVMLMPVSDTLKSRVLSFIGETMENLTRLIKMMIREEMDLADETIRKAIDENLIGRE